MAKLLSWSTADRSNSSFVAHGFPSSFQLNPADVRRGAIRVVAKAPSGQTFPMDVIENEGVYTTNFTPSEIGEAPQGYNIQAAIFSGRGCHIHQTRWEDCQHVSSSVYQPSSDLLHISYQRRGVWNVITLNHPLGEWERLHFPCHSPIDLAYSPWPDFRFSLNINCRGRGTWEIIPLNYSEELFHPFLS